MLKLIASEQQLTDALNRIQQGMIEHVPGYVAEAYTTIQREGKITYIELDEADDRDPFRFLTEEEINSLCT